MGHLLPDLTEKIIAIIWVWTMFDFEKSPNALHNIGLTWHDVKALVIVVWYVTTKFKPMHELENEWKQMSLESFYAKEKSPYEERSDEPTTSKK